jgi:hypothetical protein
MYDIKAPILCRPQHKWNINYIREIIFSSEENGKDIPLYNSRQVAWTIVFMAVRGMHDLSPAKCVQVGLVYQSIKSLPNNMGLERTLK